MPIEELLKNLPPEILEKPASLDDKGNTESGDDADDEAEEKVSKFMCKASSYFTNLNGKMYMYFEST